MLAGPSVPMPTLTPTLRAYDDLIVSVGAARGADQLGWLGLILGFLLVWLSVSVIFAVAQIGLAVGGALDAAKPI